MRDNSALPPSVFVNELLDYLDQSFVFENGDSLHSRYPVRHHLQPFHSSYFEPHGRLFSFDTAMEGGGQAHIQSSMRAGNLLQSPSASTRR